MKKNWIQSVDLLIQNYFNNVLKQINENDRQNLPLDDVERFNKNVIYAKETFKNAREEIFSKFGKIGIEPLALIPFTMVHNFGLSSGTVSEFHEIEIDDDFNMIIRIPRGDLLEVYDRSLNECDDIFEVENIVKDYSAHTASGRGSVRTKVSLPDLSMFNDKINLCKQGGFKTIFYPTIGNYHLNSFISSEYWNVFPDDEDLLLASIYKFENNKDYGETFQVILDQVPSIDKYCMVKRYEQMCSSKYLPSLYNHIFGEKYKINW